ncbi:MAG: DUF1501 domain-containing protein [Planctomycetota bacterium]|nr:MAG: DUF1501 domain-containing protein [Planctomycetota bacterium]REJ97383.1 MAG: DUF1501 domain-containing protein [Planctomycetota bacterium]
MNPTPEQVLALNRRSMLKSSSMGIAGAALASLVAGEVRAARPGSFAPSSPTPSSPTVAKPGDLRPRAKNVIFLHMVGGPSQIDLFEHKPLLNERDGQKMPDELWKGLRLAFVRDQPNLFGSPFEFARHGESGIELSRLLPYLAEVVDELTFVKSMHTEQFNHAPAQLMFHTGFGQFGRPSLGSWISYGLGSENENLPSFVVMNTGTIAGAGNSMWGSGFLPTAHQGVEFRTDGDPVLYLSNPQGIDPSRRRRILDSINRLNQERLADVGDPEIATRISQYELAFRMQTAVPELMDFSDEPAYIHKLYGTSPGNTSFANNCLLARRLVERGVRFIQLNDQGWDTHGDVQGGLPPKCRQTDRPIAALIKDLKVRGLLDETLVVFGAEFGRTPMAQGDRGPRSGRDHHKDAYTIWMAGGGVKRGFVYGKTDELGFHIVENPMHVNDFHATLLHLLGIDHEQLTYRYQGRDFRLTDVAGKVARGLFA